MNQTNIANLRCPWGQTLDEIIQEFHDHEWGKLKLDDNYLYEMLVLQLFQSGLNWRVILHKRENFRKAFKDFDPVKVAALTDKEINDMCNDSSIIRNRRKIEAAVKNAKSVIIVSAKYGSFAKYLQNIIPVQIVHDPEIYEDVPYSSDLSTKLSLQMKADGFFFVGPIVIYSYLQSIGLINDHIECCPFKYEG